MLLWRSGRKVWSHEKTMRRKDLDPRDRYLREELGQWGGTRWEEGPSHVINGCEREEAG